MSWYILIYRGDKVWQEAIAKNPQTVSCAPPCSTGAIAVQGLETTETEGFFIIYRI